MKVKNHLFLFIIALELLSCSSKRSVIGIYRSNFAQLGFFITTLNLKTDGSFEYRFQGDLIFNQATGHYVINKGKLRLTYNLTPVDTGVLRSYKKMGLRVSDSLKIENGYPHLFYLGNDKLFSSWQDGKIVRRASAYHKLKKYMLFGSHYYNKKCYLKKVE